MRPGFYYINLWCMGWPRLCKIMSFFFLYKERPSRYTFFSGGILICQNFRVQNVFLKMINFWGAAAQLKLIKIIFPLYSCKAGWLFLQYKKKLDLSMYILYERCDRTFKIVRFQRQRLYFSLQLYITWTHDRRILNIFLRGYQCTS